MDHMVFGGIDWGGHRHQLSIVDRGGHRLLDRCFDHDRSGMAELKGQLDAFSDAVPIAGESPVKWWTFSTATSPD